jgi:hypothetical protein
MVTTGMFHPIWRLSEAGADNLGLGCDEEGLFLGRTLLIERRGGRFVVRDPHDIQRLLSRAYRAVVDARPLMGGLATVAGALNANDLLLARIAAVHLRGPHGWVEDPKQTITFPPSTSVDNVINRMIAILQDATKR